MYRYTFDEETGGILLHPEIVPFSKEIRPVYAPEMDLLGFRSHFIYETQEDFPYMWCEGSRYFYRGKHVCTISGGGRQEPHALKLEAEGGEIKAHTLQPVNVEAMLTKNERVLAPFVQETLDGIYQTYLQYLPKVDAFHVSYSGGKDSEVTLDLVQRALPHDAFIVLFGDTGMEFPDTYRAVEYTVERCKELNIRFARAASHLSPLDSWRLFGPPANNIRWCCSVHKTAPQLLKLREIFAAGNLREMAFVGVRASESILRSSYQYISLGTKHKGQYSCNPILNWTSAEVYLYLYARRLQINRTYKLGNIRAGCLVCPMRGDRQSYLTELIYPQETKQYFDIIETTSNRGLDKIEDMRRFIDSGGWKLRTNGVYLKTDSKVKYLEKGHSITIEYPGQNWREWIKVLGPCTVQGSSCTLIYKGEPYNFTIEEKSQSLTVTWKENLDYLVLSNLKKVFRKTAYCIGCRECEAECSRGALSFDSDHKVHISNKCIHCLRCCDKAAGCLMFNSLHTNLNYANIKGNEKKMSLNRYAIHAPKKEWLEQFFKLKEDFFENNDLGSEMYAKFMVFLRDAELLYPQSRSLKKDTDRRYKLTPFSEKLISIGLNSPLTWALMLVNLSYSAEVGWYINNIDFNKPLSRQELLERLQNAGCTPRNAVDIVGAMLRLLKLPFSEVGLGRAQQSDNGKKANYTFVRLPWVKPDERALLYALYKFAKHCDLQQFSLEYLLDDSVEREGPSPARIFGIYDRSEWQAVLNGLAHRYPSFITTAFTFDLEHVSVNKEAEEAELLAII